MKTSINKSKQIKKALENKAILVLSAFLLVLIAVFPGQTSASAPVVTTNPPTIVSLVKVTLNGFVNPNDLNTSYWFEFSEPGESTVSFGNGNRKTAGGVKVSIIEINPEVTYSVRLVAQNADGKVYGETYSFNTSSGYISNTGSGTTYNNNNTGGSSGGSNIFGKTPIVSTAYATNVTDNGATFNGYVDPNGASGVYRWFEWGTTQSLGNISGNLSAGTNPNYFSHGVSGLERNTTYYFRAGAHSNAGTVYGTIFSFTTGASNTSTSNIAPIIMVKAPSYITGNSAQLNATAIKGGATLSNGYFEWGQGQSFGNTTQTQTLSQGSSVNMTAVLQNLKPNTDYVFRAVVQDSTSAVYRSQTISFHTTSAYSGSTSGVGSQNGGTVSKPKETSGSATGASTANKSDTDGESKNTSGAAGAFFAKTSVALLGWFLSIILLLIVIIMAVMLRKKSKEEDKISAQGFKEFPDMPGHPINK